MQNRSAKDTRIIKPPPVSELAMQRLRSEIIEGVFRLGEKLSEAQLAKRYGVTKAPIRAAFSRLQGEGLLDVRPQSGTFIFLPDVDEVRALCELRTALEMEAVALAMARNRDVLLSELQKLFNRMTSCVKSGNRSTYQDLDSAYHLVILESAKSPMLKETYQAMVNGRFSALRTRLSVQKEHAENSYREHRALIELIEKGKTKAAQDLLRDHISRTEEHYSKMLKSR